MLALALVAGCGGDDEDVPETVPTVEDVTQPETVTSTLPTQTETAPTSTETTPEPPPQDTSGGTPAPPQNEPEDTPENNRPPPPNSPAERFERFCDENPGACG